MKLEKRKKRRNMKINKLTCRCVTNSVPGMFTAALLIWTFFTEYIVTLPDLLTIYNHSTASVVCVVVLGVLYLAIWLGSFGNFVPCVLVDNSPSAHFNDAVRQRQLVEESDRAGLLAGIESNNNNNANNESNSHNSDNRNVLDPESFPRCRKCGGMKPPRAHHCSVCNKCCLKMDHHCPWIGNCVGFYNYKFFVNFLLLTVVLCLFVFLNSLPAISRAFKVSKDSGAGHSASIAVIVISAIHGFAGFTFFVSVPALLFFHMKLVTINATTLESDIVIIIIPHIIRYIIHICIYLLSFLMFISFIDYSQKDVFAVVTQQNPQQASTTSGTTRTSSKSTERTSGCGCSQCSQARGMGSLIPKSHLTSLHMTKIIKSDLISI